MLRAGLSVLLFVFLLSGVFYSHGCNGHGKDKIVTDESGRQRCKQCDRNLDDCDCRCYRCHRQFREKREIAQARIRKRGQTANTPSSRGKDPKPKVVYLSTENTCQCEELPPASSLKLGPRIKSVAFDGPSTSKMALLESSASGFFNEVLIAPAPDGRNQFDYEWVNQQYDFSLVQQQTSLVDEPANEQPDTTTSSFNDCYLESSMEAFVFDDPDSKVHQFRQLLTQVQSAIRQNVVLGLILFGWMREYTWPRRNIRTLEENEYVLTLPNPQGGFFLAVLIKEDSMIFVFLLNQDDEVMGYASNEESHVIFAINCYLNKERGKLYPVDLPDNDLFKHMVRATFKAFRYIDEKAGEVSEGVKGDSEPGVVLASDNSTGLIPIELSNSLVR
ncbi:MULTISPECIES: hypothetical protein [unclassified Endozoicomonas]|uniref:hypothetical protein n=1 Tax=unclassified Endozoicomonas TaxID=2644528 RepID=UPI003BB10FE1